MSRKTVSQWVRDARWPYGPTGPWRAADVDRWRSTTLAPNPAAAPPSAAKLQIAKTAAQIGVLQERKSKLEIERLIVQGEFIRKDAIEIKTIRNNSAIRTGSVRMARALRQVLADEDDPHKCEQILLQAFRKLFGAVYGHDDGGISDGA